MEEGGEWGGRWQTGTPPALKAQTAACFVTTHAVQATVKIQRDDRVTTGSACVRALGFISTPRRSFGNYAQGFTHGGSGGEWREGGRMA